MSWLLPQSIPCPLKGGFSAFRGRGGRTGLDFQEREICYNIFNVPVKVIDANGIVTEYEYNADGLVTSVTRKDGAETLASVSVAYDESARPVSVRDQDGRVTAFDRDAFGRVLKEKFADGSEVAYTYDAFGRRTSVLDENGHKIAFDWNRFGLSSRTTAENQLTDYVRDDDGLVTEILSKQNGRTDRAIRNEYDEYGRLVYVDYGKGETEKFTYDKWGRVASHSRGDLKTTYAYDHFGRVVKKDETSVSSSPSSFTFTSYTYDRYGSRTSRVTRNRKGEIVSKETRGYDRYGRLAETAAFGSSVKYAYDAKGHLTSQTINGELIEYVYTRRGQLAGKYLGGKLKPDAAVEYEYSKDGQITARTANGVRQTYEYDFKGQLLGVREGEEYVERYAYDKAGNMVKKTVGGKTTTFAFDDANQLVSSATDGITTRYEYDAAGRLVREGNRIYTYGYLDKVMSVRDGKNKIAYTYHPDGQLATADYGNSGRARTPAAPQGEDSPSFETFTWDGLALIQRGDEQFINEPHVGGGNPVVSSKGTSFFNDMLGTTVGAKSGKTYSAATLSAFGEDLTHHSPTPTSHSNSFFTGKPAVAGLGHAFLMRNYRASLGKWQTADPIGYLGGWNQMTYCGNGASRLVDLLGCMMAPPVPNLETYDKFREIISKLTDAGNRELLSQITIATNNECGSKIHYNYHLPDTYIDEWTSWTRTGRTKVDSNGATWYQEERYLYSYVYTTELLMEKCSGKYDVEVKLFGDCVAIVGFILAVTPGVNVSAGVVTAAAGVIPTVYFWTIGDEDDRPLGLEFFPKLDESGNQKKLTLVHRTRWVE